MPHNTQIKDTPDSPVPANDLSLTGFGLTYEDIQRGKAGDFAYLREKVRRRGKRFVFWGRVFAALYLILAIIDYWPTRDVGSSMFSLLSLVLVMAFLVAPPFIAKHQQAHLEKQLAPFEGDSGS